jgi:hypothetical protein
MKQLTLLLSLSKDSANTLASRLSWLSSQQELPSLEGRADVILLSRDAILVDQTTAHGIFAQICGGLSQAGHPYLLLPLDAESSVASGKIPEAIKTILENYNFPFYIP